MFPVGLANTDPDIVSLTIKLSAEDAVKAFVAQLAVPCSEPVNEVAVTVAAVIPAVVAKAPVIL